jgi:hypothetical protein
MPMKLHYRAFLMEDFGPMSTPEKSQEGKTEEMFMRLRPI